MTSQAATAPAPSVPVAAPVARATPAWAALRLPTDWLTLGLGAASLAWLAIALMPALVLPGAPAWPSASLGVAALVSARGPGRALPRGLGAFLGVVGILGGLAQIAVYWAIAHALP